MAMANVPNRLVKEKSPYLLQHAYNPVDWYPWGEMAFQKAELEDKPIFLSIGYSTCHWCHVMEKESFADTEVAKVLNEYFVAVKVDREERPDVDQIYMNVCQQLTGQGGWPLTIFMTPAKEPFFAGTYFPKEDKWGRPGLLNILTQLNNKWQTDRERLKEIGEKITEAIQFSPREAEDKLTGETLRKVFKDSAGDFDVGYGGFGRAPKFPMPHRLMFLLRYQQMKTEPQALEMVTKTLLSMYKGGIYDHLGYGFCRYSTDRQWLVPHFEKMLYDNALLAYAYLETYQVTGEKFYARIAENIFTYVLRDMTSSEGGFYSAEDADSEGVEGKFYLWTPREVKHILGTKDGDVFCNLYDIFPGGNFEGKSIPNLIKYRLNETNDILDMLHRMEPLRKKLFIAREKRIRPHKDDKILTSWNGLMIAALAKGRQVMQKYDYLEAAVRAAEFIWQKLRRSDGRLLARYREGEAAIPAYLDDYAFLTWGLLELYEATFNPKYLGRAVALTDQMLDLFGDDTRGGLFFYGYDGEQLIARPKEAYDGALPSGNSVTTLNLLRLMRITGKSKYEKAAINQMGYFAAEARGFPSGYTFFLLALQFSLAEPQEIIIIGKPEDIETQTMLADLQKKFLPHAVLIFCPLDKTGDKLKTMLPFLKGYRAVGGKTTAYVCKNYSCQAPVIDGQQLLDLI